jgi:uncharacterized membrane protein YfcA
VRLVLIGLAAGVLSAVFGVGGGIIIVPLLILAVGFATREATATSLGAVLVIAGAGALLYALRGEVRVEYALLVGLPAMAGAFVGVSAQRRVSGRSLTLGFAVLVAGIGTWLLVG